MGRFEVQVLDSYQNKTYPTARRGRSTGMRAVGERFPETRRMAGLRHYLSRPKKRADGTVEAGSLTVLHNGILVQDHVPVKEPRRQPRRSRGCARRTT